jgi:hypothetical protein
VRDVDDPSGRLNAQDDALHGAGEMIGCSEVGGKSDEPWWHGGEGAREAGLPDVSADGGGKSTQNDV